MKPLTAKEIAAKHPYEWIPLDRFKPPPMEAVEVLYADGLVGKAVRPEGGPSQFMVMDDGMYRYAAIYFWRPIKAG